MARYELIEEGQSYETVQAKSLEAALRRAKRQVDPGSYEYDKTIWINVRAIRLGRRGERTDDEATGRVTLNPAPPGCVSSRKSNHDWQAPRSVVGGLKENPGVSGKGGGIVAKEVCWHCGAYRITDTWAQDPDTGEQGLESVEYRPADESSEAWIAARSADE